jgi:hypothetical protein
MFGSFSISTWTLSTLPWNSATIRPEFARQTVNASPDLQGEFIRFHPVFNGQLGQITRRARALDFLVAPDAREGPVGADELTLAAEIALPQDELDQVAHRNRVHGF